MLSRLSYWGMLVIAEKGEQRMPSSNGWREGLATAGLTARAALHLFGCLSPSLQMVEKQEGAESETREEVRHVCLPWYPDRLAYQLNLTRMDIRYGGEDNKTRQGKTTFFPDMLG